MEKLRSLQTLPLDGGTLPFHFINTVYAWRGENLHEYLNNYEEFLAWCRKVHLLRPALLEQLLNNGKKNRVGQETAFRYILDLRELFYRFFSGVAGNAVPQVYLKKYNEVLQKALGHFEWVQYEGELTFILKEDTSDLLLPVWVIMQAAHQLLLEADRSRIKECSRCGWIFLDQTRNGKRRWCNPNSCGSIEKMSRYYQKIKKQKTG